VSCEPPDSACRGHVKAITLVAILGPLAGLIAAIALLWGVAFDWVHLALLGAMYILTGLGITVGYHRLFTHRSFEAPAPVRFALGVLGSMAAQGPVLYWAAVHRCHHRFSDREEDPHSPHGKGGGAWGVLKGFWHAHMGWLLRPDPPGLTRYVTDLERDRVVRWVSRTCGLWLVLGLVLPGVLGGLLTLSWTGVLLGFLWGGLVRVFLLHHLTWSINSVCHLWGYRTFRTPDQSRNNPVMGLLGLGEGWHNNHHAFPSSARHGLRAWELDTSYLVIRFLEVCRLARAVRIPERERLEAKLGGGRPAGRRR
jgi:stearoyl-CoA desaturase (Delta-9 desaturase)